MLHKLGYGAIALAFLALVFLAVGSHGKCAWVTPHPTADVTSQQDADVRDSAVDAHYARGDTAFAEGRVWACTKGNVSAPFLIIGALILAGLAYGVYRHQRRQAAPGYVDRVPQDPRDPPVPPVPPRPRY